MPEIKEIDWTWRWTCDPALLGDEGARADRLVFAAIEAGLGEWRGEPRSCSRSLVQRLMDEERVTAGGALVHAKGRIPRGAVVEARFPEATPSTVEPQDLPVEILYQDEHLLVVNKPQGLTVHPSPTQMEGTLVNALLHLVREGRVSGLSSVGGELRPGIVHRLDKDTSGALVITKTDEAHRKLVDTFSKHDIERRYWALCYGTARVAEQTIKTTLGRSPADRKKMAVNVRGGREAITHARVVERFGLVNSPYASFFELTLETGRTHQIRVHLTSIHCSILGDPVYGSPTASQSKWTALPNHAQELVEKLPGQALHARVLGFEHPITGEKLRFVAEPPAAFLELLESLRGATGP